jgi:XTP/dITP diphosphohydrolase
MKKILIATNNKGKVAEIAGLLAPFGVETISAVDFNLEEPEENGLTFEANSIIKAKYYGDKTGEIALADDSGLCIDLLSGEPGIYSARWAVDENGKKDFSRAFEKIKADLTKKGADVEYDKINAHFVCNLSLYNPNTKEVKSFEGKVFGHLTFPARGNRGFGYDPIFVPNRHEKTFGEMNSLEKEKISHRTAAFNQLKAELKK